VLLPEPRYPIRTMFIKNQEFEGGKWKVECGFGHFLLSTF
jgi:hypothetical protein